MYDETNEKGNTGGFAGPGYEGGASSPFDTESDSVIRAQPQVFTQPTPEPESPQAQPADTVPHTVGPVPQAQPANPDTAPYTQQPYVRQPYVQHPYVQQGTYGQPYGQPGVYAGPGPGVYTQPNFAQTPPPIGPAAKPKKEKKPRKPLNISAAALVLVIVVCCAASGIGGGLIGASVNGENTIPVIGGRDNVTINASDDVTVTEAVAKKVLSSVVGITATGNIVSADFFFGQHEEEVTGVGTGMVLDTQGYILTNSHVVMDGTVNSIKVLLSTGDEVEGRVIWSDASLDLAIVKIEAEGLSPVELGNSDEVPIGSYVAAIGNPLGLAFNGSITQGVVSGLDRTITVSDELGSNVIKMEGLIQVDAAINGGNSGGPLLNSKGQVIGVNTAKAQAEGMGFAIPINTAIPIVEKVIRDGSFERVYMGISAADVAVVKENYPNVELLAETGAVVTDVNPGSPAEKAGLKVKDVIISLDGKEISGSSQMIKLLLGYESGDTIRLVYLRDGEESETTLTLVSFTELNKIQEELNPFKNPQSEENQNRVQPGNGNSGNPFDW
ncbi:MAG: trypsin-like peptidase domain-containing protein [Clostridiales Family XIII bacterium]|jgi:S1-C subfamily serine protease|nr:trypsin-like peptidase domain-containing protein [Clostridiales Family XIII bacterium]